jgi:hypothetical protein
MQKHFYQFSKHLWKGTRLGRSTWRYWCSACNYATNCAFDAQNHDDSHNTNAPGGLNNLSVGSPDPPPTEIPVTESVSEVGQKDVEEEEAEVKKDADYQPSSDEDSVMPINMDKNNSVSFGFMHLLQNIFPSHNYPQKGYYQIAKYLWRGSEFGTDERKYFCSVCSYTNLKSRAGALSHAKKHENYKTSGEFKCHVCERMLHSKSGLTIHMKFKHPDLSRSEEQTGEQLIVEGQSQPVAGPVVDANVII